MFQHWGLLLFVALPLQVGWRVQELNEVCPRYLPAVAELAGLDLALSYHLDKAPFGYAQNGHKL